jgi:DNA repair photolyase
MKYPVLLDYDVAATDWDGPYELIQCKKALHPSNMGDTKYSLNPYGGCEHGCIYCFAPGHTHSDISTWRVVRVKTNIVERLSKELDFTEGCIGLGTVTDAYQAAEGRFRLSRMCLETIARKNRSVFIITKSDLVTRDVDILRHMDSTVAFTVTSPEDRVCRMTEPGAPTTRERLAAARILKDNGVRVMAFVAPVLSTLEGHEEELLVMIKNAEIDTVFVDWFKPRGVSMERMDRMGITGSEKAERRLYEIGRDMGLEMIPPRSFG